MTGPQDVPQEHLLQAAILDLQERVRNLQGALRNRDREVAELLLQLRSHHRYIVGLTGDQDCALCRAQVPDAP